MTAATLNCPCCLLSVLQVIVYRLVSKNTYEQQLFECSSKKMGLDEAILGFAGSGGHRAAVGGPEAAPKPLSRIMGRVSSAAATFDPRMAV